MKLILNDARFKTVWYWLSFGVTFLGIITLIVYLTNGTTRLDPNYSVGMIVGLCIGIAFGFLNIVKTFNVCLYAQYVFYIFAFFSYLMANVNLYGSIVYGVDGQSIPANFIITVLFTFILWTVALSAAIIMPRSSKKTAISEENNRGEKANEQVQ